MLRKKSRTRSELSKNGLAGAEARLILPILLARLKAVPLLQSLFD
jgi:hypothetical protein